MYQDNFSFEDLKYPEFKVLFQRNPIPTIGLKKSLLPFFAWYKDIVFVESTLNYYIFKTNTGQTFTVNITDFGLLFPYGLPHTQEAYDKWRTRVG
jgi:hypothetical protein